MKISLDDGDTWIDAPGVRVIAENVDDAGTDVHFNFTHEGLITDVVIEDEIEASTSEMHFDVADRVCLNRQ